MKFRAVAAPLRAVVVTASVGLSLAATALLAVHYLMAARSLAGENAQLKDQMQTLVERLADVESSMGRVAAARRQVDRTTLAGLGAVLEHAGVNADREAGLARALAPVEEQPGPLAAGLRAVAYTELGAGNGPFVALMDRMNGDRDRAGRLAADLAETAGAVASRQRILRAMPSVLPAKGSISSDFGMRESPFHPGFVGMHNGIDVAAEEGAPVTATADGVVVFAGTNGGFGKLVTIDHGYGITTKYGHNSLLLVKKGERVVRGQSIATVGNTGRSTGAHVHYEVALYDKPVDPRRFLFDAAPDDIAPRPAMAHLALGGDAPAVSGGAAEGDAALRGGSEWDAPILSVQDAAAPAVLRRVSAADTAAAALGFLLMAVAAAVMRLPGWRVRKALVPVDDSANAELIRAFYRKEALKKQAAEF